MNSMFQLLNKSNEDSFSDTSFKGEMNDSKSDSNIEIGQSFFSLLKEFNDFSQSIYKTSLLQAGVDYDTHLILFNIYTDQSISLAQLLIATGLPYGSLKLLLENLENGGFVTKSGLEDDPASIQLVLTAKGIVLFESIQQCVNSAGLDILKNLPKCGVHLRNIIIDRSEEKLVLEQNNQLFNDDLVVDEASKIDNNVQDKNKTNIISEVEILDHDLENFKLEDEKQATSEEKYEEDRPITESKINIVFSEIRNVAIKEYPNSYSLQLYKIEEEFNAYLKIEELNLGDIPRDIFEKIRVYSLEEEGYESQLYVIEKEIDAYFRLKTLSPSPIPVTIFDGICKSVKDEYPDSYSTQLYYIEDKIFSYAKIGNLFSVPQEIMNKISDFVVTEYSDYDLNHQKSEIKDQIRAYFNLQFRLEVSDISDNVMQKINSESEKYYSDNFEEYFREVSRQISSFGKLKSLATKRVPRNIFKEIKSNAANIYDNDFSSQMNGIEEGIRSYCRIENFSALGISEKKLNKIKSKAKKIDADDYSWQLEEIEKQVSAYYKKKNSKKLSSGILKKINKIASKEYKNDYSGQESEVKRQVRDYWQVLEITPELFFIELGESPSNKIDETKVTVLKKEIDYSEDKKTTLNSLGEVQVAIPSVLMEGKISNLNEDFFTLKKKKVHGIKGTELKKWVFNKLTKNEGVISLQEACEVAFGSCPNRLESTQIRLLAQKLSAEKIGISPDPKFVFKQQHFSDCGVIFNLSFSAKTVEQERVSEKYKIAYLMLHLGMKAAQSDNIIVDAETDIIQKIVMKNPGLSVSEKARLQADLKRLMQSKISLEFMASMLKGLSSKHKEGVAHLAFRVVTSDNVIETSELNFLLWLYEQLGFPQEKIQQKIKMIGDLPSTIARNFPEQVLTNILGYKIEKTDHNDKKDTELEAQEIGVNLDEPDEVSGNTTLDENRISELRDEDSTDFLQEIFVTSIDEEEHESILFNDIHDEINVESLDNNRDKTQCIKGLDTIHGKLLLSLFEKDNPDWNWFELHTREYELMANGAMETLNEWGYEYYNEPVLEDDPFSVNAEFRSYLNIDEEDGLPENISNSEETKQVTKKEESLVRDDRQIYSKFLEDLLVEKNLDQNRFSEMAASYGLTYDEAFELLT